MSRPTSRTTNGASMYKDAGDKHLQFFSKAGSMFAPKSNQKTVGSRSPLPLFEAMWTYGKNPAHDMTAFKLLLHLRDPRGGAGNRSGARECLRWLAKNDTKWIIANINLVVEYGRWDDLRAFYNTPAESAAVSLWADAIKAKNGLACKWADRRWREQKVARKLEMTPRQFRKVIVSGSVVVETLMCAKKWSDIIFSAVPSKAMKNYKNAFMKHVLAKFEMFQVKVATGEEKVNASTLFPHDLILEVQRNMHGTELAKLAITNQWNALPNFMVGEGTRALRIMPIADTSGSMDMEYASASTGLRAMTVSKALALYCSDKVGINSPFYRKFMEFTTETKLTDWSDMDLFQAFGSFNLKIGSTNIINALNTLLDLGSKWSVPNDQMVNAILIISDMQFDTGTKRNRTPVEEALDKWEAAGYDRPVVIYWNVTGSAGSPATAETNNVGKYDEKIVTPIP